MQITIPGGQGGSGRRVAREVDMENYTTVDQVGDVEVEKAEKEARNAKLNEMSETERTEFKEQEKKIKERLLREEERKRKLDEKVNIDLDKVVIKKREKKNEEKSLDDKVLVVKKPNSMIAKLAEKRKELSLLDSSVAPKSDQEKIDLRKKFKEQFVNEEKITEKVLNMALESVFYDEDQGNHLINLLLEQDEKKQEADVEQKEENDVEDAKIDGNIEEVVDGESSVDAHDELDFEAEEPEKTE
eukprot:GFUD01129103.1.p1 GENE.GFUD01129103.1~~GFUD01129103.1.p1  ORF type:complete len:244 (-),score=111.21 GFUD01129103.1:83-814(-)